MKTPWFANKPVTLAELRATVGDSEPEQCMLAAINGAASRCGDDLFEIASTLFGAYVVIAKATGQGEAVLKIAEEGAVEARRDITHGVGS